MPEFSIPSTSIKAYEGRWLDDEKEIRSLNVGGRPYDVLLARNGLLYVSDWAGRQVIVVKPEEMRVIARIAVGEHPNQIVQHPKDDRLFVACASSNCVSVIDAKRGVSPKRFSPLYSRAPRKAARPMRSQSRRTVRHCSLPMRTITALRTSTSANATAAK